MLQIPDCVKKLFYQDGTHKNCRIEFPNGERADIINDQIVAESLSMTESICSRGTLKFGLVEPSKLQVTVVNVENIKGYKIRVWLEIDCSSLTAEEIAEHAEEREDLDYPIYPVPYGTYTVDSCEREAGSKKRKIVAYSREISEIGEISLSKIDKANMSYPLWKNDNYTINLMELAATVLNADIMDKAASRGPHGGSYERFENMWVDVNNDGNKDVIRLRDFYGVSGAYTSFYGSLQYHEFDFYTSPSLSYENEIRLHRIETPILAQSKNRAKENLMQYFTQYLGNRRYQFEFGDYTFDDDTTVMYLKKAVDRFVDIFYKRLTTAIVEINNLTINLDISDVEKLMDGAFLYYDGTGQVFQNVTIYSTATVRPSTSMVEGVSEYTFIERKGNVKYDERIIQNAVIKTFKRKPIGVVGGRKSYSAEYLIEELNVRGLIDAQTELYGVFCASERESASFRYISISRGIGLYPAETLYPAEDLYPTQSEGVYEKGTYMSAWYDDYENKPFGKIACSYRNTNNEDAYIEKIIRDDPGGIYQTYDISDNDLIRDGTFTEAQMQQTLDTMAENIKGVPAYMPCNIKALGLPFLEVGDGVDFVTDEGVISTFIMRRTISGIQHLVDTIESR